MQYTYEQRKAWQNAENITLNDKPAVIRGAKLARARVSTLDGTLSAEFLWEAVQDAVENQSGRFRVSGARLYLAQQ